MARTLSRGLADEELWQGGFRDGYVAALRAAGHAIIAAEPEPIRRLPRRSWTSWRRWSTGRAPTPRLWPVYGGLLINLRNILDAMDEVAAANPMRQPPVPFRRDRRMTRSRFRGSIAGAGSTSGVRVVVGHWPVDAARPVLRRDGGDRRRSPGAARAPPGGRRLHRRDVRLRRGPDRAVRPSPSVRRTRGRCGRPRCRSTWRWDGVRRSGSRCGRCRRGWPSRPPGAR